MGGKNADARLGTLACVGHVAAGGFIHRLVFEVLAWIASWMSDSSGCSDGAVFSIFYIDIWSLRAQVCIWLRKTGNRPMDYSLRPFGDATFYGISKQSIGIPCV